MSDSDKYSVITERHKDILRSLHVSDEITPLVAAELASYRYLLTNADRVYWHVTGGMARNAHTPAHEVISAYEDIQKSLSNDYLQDIVYDLLLGLRHAYAANTTITPTFVRNMINQVLVNRENLRGVK